MSVADGNSRSVVGPVLRLGGAGCNVGDPGRHSSRDGVVVRKSAMDSGLEYRRKELEARGRNFGVVRFAKPVWNSELKNQDLDHLSRLFCVAKLDLAECATITNLGLAKLRGLEFLAELNLARLYPYRNARYVSVSGPLTDACVIYLKPLTPTRKADARR